MKTILILVTMLASVPLFSCFENASCTSGCVNVSVTEKDDAAAIDQKLRAACERLGLKGTPEITERSASSVSGHCPN